VTGSEHTLVPWAVHKNWTHGKARLIRESGWFLFDRGFKSTADSFYLLGINRPFTFHNLFSQPVHPMLLEFSAPGAA